MSVSNREPDAVAKTRLDSHAITPVVGYNSYVWRDTGKTVNVNGFTKALGQLSSVPIVDAMIVYECPYTGKSYLMMINNALYVGENPDNYISPFILREAGIEVDTTAKLHCKNPSIANHSMYFTEDDLRVHFNITGIVSYFMSRKPTPEEINELPVLYLTPDNQSWDPYDVKYEREEDVMLDHEGNIIPKKDRVTLLDLEDDGMDIQLEDIDFDVAISALFHSVNLQSDIVLGEDKVHEYESCLQDRVIAAVDPIYDPVMLVNSLND